MKILASFQNHIEVGTERRVRGYSVPEVTKANVSYILSRLRDAATEYKRAGRNPMGAVAETNSLWADPNYSGRTDSIPILSRMTGFSERMIDKLCFLPYGWDLSSLYIDIRSMTLGNPQPYKYGFVIVNKDDRHKPILPSLIVHIGFGNLPGYDPLGLLTGFSISSIDGCKLPGQLFKLSHQQPFFVFRYISSLETIDPELARTVFTGYWEGGDNELEKQIFRNADVILPSGKTETIKDVARRANSLWCFGRKPYVITRHNTKVGQGLHHGDFSEEDATLYAFDAAAFYGVSCFNLKNLTIVGTPSDAKDIAEMLSESLEKVVGSLGTIQDDEYSLAIGDDLLKFQRTASAIEDSSLFIPRKGLGYVVAYIPMGSEFPLLDKGVGIVVSSVGSEEEYLSKIAKIPKDMKQTIVTDYEDLGYLSRIAESGFTRICFPGYAPYPQPGPHDGAIDSIDIIQGGGYRLTTIERDIGLTDAKIRNLKRLAEDFDIR